MIIENEWVSVICTIIELSSWLVLEQYWKGGLNTEPLFEYQTRKTSYSDVSIIQMLIIQIPLYNGFCDLPNLQEIQNFKFHFRLLNSPHFVLRKSSVSCLRQFSQKEAKDVFGFASKENAYLTQGVIHLNRQFGEFQQKKLGHFQFF